MNDFAPQSSKPYIFFLCIYYIYALICPPQVDTEYKLQNMKKLLKDWEMKGKAFKKRLDDIQMDLVKHMDQ